MTSEFNEQAEKTVRTENCDQLSRCKALESVHHALVRANDHLPERLERVAHGGRQGRACRLFRSRNSFTRSGPNVTRPGPRAFGRKPVMLSFSVGSLKSALAVLESECETGQAHLHSRSMSTAPPFSIVSGRWRSSSCSTVSIDRPIPPKRALEGKQRATSSTKRTVHTDDPLLDHCSKWHPVEQRVEALPGPDTVLLACGHVSDRPIRKRTP